MRYGRCLTVLKLGGSHAFARHLRHWLKAIARGAGHVVVVPGGGPFADAVRTAQGKMGFDDDAAHHMALLAMEQYGRALASLEPRLRPADSLAAIRRLLRAGDVPVWSPTRMVLAAKDIPCSWDVTSDSLAVWLAGRLGAARVVLVKHGEPRADTVRARDLVGRGIVDPAFARFLDGVDASIVGPAGHAAAAAAWRNGQVVGSRIESR
jgi:5-(aminomethyl)-3-furanmethanol phosphate kinase